MNKKNDVENLTTEQRLLVLGWMVEAIDQGMQQQIKARAYAAFVTALHGGTPYSVSEVWKQLPESTKNHFDHASDILLHLQDEVERLEDDLEGELSEGEEDPEVEEPDPFSEDVAPVNEVDP